MTTGLNDAQSAKLVVEVDNVINRIQGTLKHISSEVDTIKAGWKGDANNAFSKVAAEWDAEAARLNKKIDAVNQAYDGSVNKGLTNLEQDVAQQLGSLTPDLGAR